MKPDFDEATLHLWTVDGLAIPAAKPSGASEWPYTYRTRGAALPLISHTYSRRRVHDTDLLCGDVERPVRRPQRRS